VALDRVLVAQAAPEGRAQAVRVEQVAEAVDKSELQHRVAAQGGSALRRAALPFCVCNKLPALSVLDNGWESFPAADYRASTGAKPAPLKLGCTYNLPSLFPAKSAARQFVEDNNA
jgi:hypothetical protein